MAALQEPRRADVRLDDLRRRLYRADATAEDVRRYLDERPLPQAALAVEAPVEPAPPHRPPRFAGAVIAIALVGVIVGTTLLHEPDGLPTIDVPTRITQQVSHDIGNGEILRVHAGRVIGPTPMPVDVDGVAAVGQLYEGVGNAVIAVDLPATASGAGRAAVTMSSTRTTSVSWRALRSAARRDRSTFQQVVAMQILTSNQGFSSPMQFGYKDGPPSRFAVSAPPGLHWKLLIAATADEEVLQ